MITFTVFASSWQLKKQMLDVQQKDKLLSILLGFRKRSLASNLTINQILGSAAYYLVT